MGRGHLQNSDVNRSHEPIGIPLNRPPGTFSPTGGEGWDEGERFMERFPRTFARVLSHEHHLPSLRLQSFNQRRAPGTLRPRQFATADFVRESRIVLSSGTSYATRVSIDG